MIKLKMAKTVSYLSVDAPSNRLSQANRTQLAKVIRVVEAAEKLALHSLSGC